jgi:site-specific recombinase XerD
MSQPNLDHLLTRYVWERSGSRELCRDSALTVRYALASFVRSVGPDRPPRSLREADVVRWLADAPWTASTATHNLSRLRGFVAWLVRNRHVARDFTSGLHGPRMPQVVPRGLDQGSVRAALVESCPDTRARVMVVLMVQEGLRCCEVSRLQVGDLNLRAGSILVRGKGSKERVLPLSAESAEAIRDYLAAWPAKAGPVVRSYNHPKRGISPAYVSWLVTRYLRDAGVEATAHALRHTAATDMLVSGAHLRDVQKALGHAHLTSTERYLPWVVAGLAEAMGGRWYGSGEPPVAA